MLALRGKLVHLELLVKMAVLAPLALRVLVVNLESWDSPDPRVLMVRLGKQERKDSLELLVYVVCLVKTVRRVLQDLLDQLALQEKEENRVSLDLLDSRGCPDPLVPLVKEVNLVTRVYQEKQVLLGPQDLGVSVGSQEREEVQDQQASRGPVGFQEHLDLMDQRVLLALLVFQVLRGHRVCRECLEREEHLGFLDQKVTEETTVRKDLKVLLEKMVQEV